jgi:uncharacterized protein YceK
MKKTFSFLLLLLLATSCATVATTTKTTTTSVVANAPVYYTGNDESAVSGMFVYANKN